jgi:Flp pilus assembly protein TadD
MTTKTTNTVRRFMRAVGLLLAAGLCIPLCACAPAKSSSYTTPREQDRKPGEAERLNLEAAAIIDSDPSQAEALLRRALTADLYNGPAHNNLGTIYLRRGELYSAAEEFEWARKLMPGHPDPRMNLALALETAGRHDEAIATYRTALEVYPNHIHSMQALARLQVRLGRADDETPHLLSEISMRGENPQWREWAQWQLTKSAE